MLTKSIYEYMLKMEARSSIATECGLIGKCLAHGKKPLFVFEKGIARDCIVTTTVESLRINSTLTRSGIGFLHAHSDNKKLTRFKKELTNTISRESLPAISSSQKSARLPEQKTAFFDPLMQNFTEWYWSACSEKTWAPSSGCSNELKEVLPEF